MPAVQFFAERGFILGGANASPRTVSDSNVEVLSNGNQVSTFNSTSTQNGALFGLNVVVQDASGAIITRFALSQPGFQGGADIHATSDGGFVVAWANRATPNGPNDIYLQRFDAQGNVVSAPILVNQNADTTSLSTEDITPAITELSDGTLALAWTSYRLGTADIYVSTLTAQGVPIGQDVLVNSAVAGAQYSPIITAFNNGTFLVAWPSEVTNESESELEIYARIFDREAAPVTGQFLANTQTEGYQQTPSATTLSNGNVIMVWASDGIIKGQLLSPAGTKLGAEFTVAPQQYYQALPFVDAHPDGGFVVAWYDLNSGISARSFASDTAPLSTSFRIIDALTSSFEFALRGQTDLVFSSDDSNIAYVRIAKSVAAVTLTGTAAAEDLYGNSLDNTIIGLAGNDQLFGGPGQDNLYGGTGRNFIDGGPGTDWLDYADWAFAVQVDLLNNVAAHEDATDYVFNVENVIGTAFNDILIGDAQINRLDGGAGDDLLVGGAGADVLIGGAGIDNASYEGNFGGVFVNLTLGRGYTNFAFGDTYDSIENVIGSQFADFLIGDPGANRLDGRGGNDTIIGGLGPDVLIGGSGADNDTLSYEDNSGTVFVDLKAGKGYNNAAEGDTYVGFENVIGGLFDDTLIGDDGINFLDGAMGADTLVGNGGADTFAFSYAPGATSIWGSPNVDTIYDFESGQDKLAVSSTAFGGGLAKGALPAGAFLVGSSAGDADDRFIYDQGNGKLYFDADGNGPGAQVLVAILPNRDAIFPVDFIIV